MNGIDKKIVEYLKSHHAKFEQVHHAPAGSVEEYQKTLGTRLEQQAKALFIRFKRTGSKGFVVATMPANKKADLNQIRKELVANEVRLGTKEQLEETTGCTYGELPPLGKFFSLPLLMDKGLLSEEKIYFNAGSLSFSIIISPEEIVRIEEPVLFETP